MRSQTITVAAAAIVAVGLLLAGCAGSTAPAPAPTEPAFGHVHGIINLGEGTVLLGAHTGLYTLTAAGVLAGPVGGNDFDAMGLTAHGDTLYASGHPGPATPTELGEHNLGIVRSIDAGATWEPVAFTGQEDFHVLTATAEAIYGIGSSSITVRTSPDGGTTWVDGANLPAVDLAATLDGALYAATQDGVQESRDAGATFAPVPDAPLLYLLESDPAGGLVGVDTDGALWRLNGAGWERSGTASGTVQALGTTADGAIVLVDDRGVVWMRGTEATVVLPSGARS
ncbi:F510_1955 family glycosylhydrolase [Microbacterium sp. 5K110]|uniref:F510_1955 family glycosylhydrolase n=1 Tax=unclassified Microbacterium TaxID=2609290 RepID=UPI0010FF365A|nr:hypothetical protein [Microbacterium sp. 5K110]TLF29712.1 hypothetical protein FE256_12300 [Microbacterium sp. 5K110]